MPARLPVCIPCICVRRHACIHSTYTLRIVSFLAASLNAFKPVFLKTWRQNHWGFGAEDFGYVACIALSSFRCFILCVLLVCMYLFLSCAAAYLGQESPDKDGPSEYNFNFLEYFHFLQLYTRNI